MFVRSLLAGVALVCLGVVMAADAPPAPAPNVFDLPQLQIQHTLLQAAMAASFKNGDYANGEKACRAAIQLVPHDPNSHYNLACALARQGKTEDALASLERAIELGFRGADHLKGDDDLASLRETDRFQKAVEAAAQDKLGQPLGWQYQVEPAAVVDGVATVDTANTAWDVRRGVFVSLFKLDTTPAADPPIAKGFGEAGDLLNKWQAEGTAAGNRGDLYDNHDSDHSNMDYGTFPQLTRIEFAEAPKSRGIAPRLAGPVPVQRRDDRQFLHGDHGRARSGGARLAWP